MSVAYGEGLQYGFRYTQIAQATVFIGILLVLQAECLLHYTQTVQATVFVGISLVLQAGSTSRFYKQIPLQYGFLYTQTAQATSFVRILLVLQRSASSTSCGITLGKDRSCRISSAACWKASCLCCLLASLLPRSVTWLLVGLDVHPSVFSTRCRNRGRPNSVDPWSD